MYRVDCPPCGEYEITDMAEDICPGEFLKSNLYFLSSLARSSWARRKRFRIDAKTYPTGRRNRVRPHAEPVITDALMEARQPEETGAHLHYFSC
jgi:hypothetical protein